MARRRVVEAPQVDVRAELAARWRRNEERWAKALGQPVDYRKVDALEAGEPVELHGWEVSGFFEAPREFSPNDRLRLEADGSLVVLPKRRGW